MRLRVAMVSKGCGLVGSGSRIGAEEKGYIVL